MILVAAPASDSQHTITRWPDRTFARKESWLRDHRGTLLIHAHVHTSGHPLAGYHGRRIKLRSLPRLQNSQRLPPASFFLKPGVVQNIALQVLLIPVSLSNFCRQSHSTLFSSRLSQYKLVCVMKSEPDFSPATG